MSPEIILLAIGCYLFCGVEEKIYRIKKTGIGNLGLLTLILKKVIRIFFYSKNNV